MVNAKLNEAKNCLIVKRVSIIDTLRNIPHGMEAHFTRRELGNRDGSVMSAVSRLNTAAGAKEYAARIDDADGSYWIRRG